MENYEQPSLYEFIQQSPFVDLDINLERQDSVARDIIFLD